MLINPLFAALLGIAAMCEAAGAAPAARWILPEEEPKVEEQIEITCRTEWAEGDATLNVLPATKPSLDWGSLEILRSESGIEADTLYVDHVYALTAAAPGRFMLPELDIPYLPGDSAESEEVPTLTAPSLEIEIRPFNRALYAAGGAASLTAVLAAVFVGLRLRKKSTTPSSQTELGDPHLNKARAALNRARTLRIDGDFYGCYQALVESASTLGSGHESLAAELATRAQAAGYGGSRPDDTVLDSDIRSVERAIRLADTLEDSEMIPTANQNEVPKK